MQCTCAPAPATGNHWSTLAWAWGLACKHSVVVMVQSVTNIRNTGLGTKSRSMVQEVKYEVSECECLSFIVQETADWCAETAEVCSTDCSAAVFGYTGITNYL